MKNPIDKELESIEKIHEEMEGWYYRLKDLSSPRNYFTWINVFIKLLKETPLIDIEQLIENEPIGFELILLMEYNDFYFLDKSIVEKLIVPASYELFKDIIFKEKSLDIILNTMGITAEQGAILGFDIKEYKKAMDTIWLFLSKKYEDRKRLKEKQ